MDGVRHLRVRQVSPITLCVELDHRRPGYDKSTPSEYVSHIILYVSKGGLSVRKNEKKTQQNTKLKYNPVLTRAHTFHVSSLQVPRVRLLHRDI